MSSYFIIKNIDKKLKYNYILLSTGQKGQELTKNAVNKLRERSIYKHIQNFQKPSDTKSNKWIEYLENKMKKQLQTKAENVNLIQTRKNESLNR